MVGVVKADLFVNLDAGMHFAVIEGTLSVGLIGVNGVLSEIDPVPGFDDYFWIGSIFPPGRWY